LKRFVLDASVALAWFIDHPIAPYALRVQRLLLAGDRAVVPPLWRLEVANGFVVAERRGILTPSDTAQILQNFQIVLAQAIEENQQSLTLPRVIATAREFQLTAYDADYLETARTHQLPLATLDRRLEEAAVRAGVPLVRG
jgi:predicted nucleic acid-binding protein